MMSQYIKKVVAKDKARDAQKEGQDLQQQKDLNNGEKGPEVAQEGLVTV